MLADNYQAEIQRRDRMLQVITEGVGELMLSESMQEMLPRVLGDMAQIVNFDGLQVRDTGDREHHRQAPPCFSWIAAGAPRRPPMSDFKLSEQETLELRAGLEPLYQGRCIYETVKTAPPAKRRIMTYLGIVSNLMVPVRVRGRHWGFVTFDDCHGEHQWAPEDTNVLKLLAAAIGSVITRDRMLDEMRARDALLAAVNGGAHEIVTAPLLHEAIGHSLERAARAVGADRIFVLEVAHSVGGLPLLLHHNSWHVPEAPLELGTLLGASTGPEGEAYRAWQAPLQRGQAVSGSLRQADPLLRQYFERLKLRSTLVVPVTVDGKYWGHIGLDACRDERQWNPAEIGILKTLADLIGAALMRERYIGELANANTIVQNSPTILFRLRGEPSFPMIYISHNIKLLGHDPQLLLSSPTLYHSLVHADDRANVQATMAGLLRPDAPAVTVEHRLLTSVGAVRWVENRCTPVRDGSGRLLEIEGIVVDVTERKAAEEKIAQLARTDVLTGLHNRSTFGERLRHAFAAARRGAVPFVVLYLDLDRFKDVNDTYGHAVGDELLQEAAARLRGATRETDVVARLGGDEFAILQTDVGDPAAAGILAAKLIEAIGRPYLIGGNELRIGVSVGISPWSEEVATPEQLVAQADQALYLAKEEGRGHYRFHSRELDAETHERMELAENLRCALERGELELYYQPQVELSNGRITGMEALIRWNHPERGLLLPQVFLPIAEKAGLMQPLGRWVLDGACAALRRWRDENMEVPVVAVNVGLAHLRTGVAFVTDVMECLQRYGLEPRDLELDVTELILARVTLAQNNALEELHKLGVRIAIDDFGTQYSSFDYLRLYQVSRLKLSRPMVSAATDEGAGIAMVRAIMSLAHDLGIEVVAEGVETEDQRRRLLGLGAQTKAQGYLYSTALPADEAEKQLREGVLKPR